MRRFSSREHIMGNGVKRLHRSQNLLFGSTLFSVIVASACASSSAAPSGSAPGGCVTGPRGDPRALLPFVSDGAHYPECAYRCGAHRGQGSFYSVADLPSGACDSTGSCSATGGVNATYPAGCVAPDVAASQYCAINGYRCDCVNGAWSCVVTEQGGGACVVSFCPGADGGAATDGGR